MSWWRQTRDLLKNLLAALDQRRRVVRLCLHHRTMVEVIGTGPVPDRLTNYADVYAILATASSIASGAFSFGDDQGAVERPLGPPAGLVGGAAMSSLVLEGKLNERVRWWWRRPWTVGIVLGNALPAA